MDKKHLLMVVGTLVAVVSFQASAQVSGLYNTGVDTSGTPLPDGTIGDPHYTLVSVPDGTSDLLVRTSAGGNPIPPYIGDDSISAWIGPNNSQDYSSDYGEYDYQTTFTVGSTPVAISGQYAVDDGIVNVLLNGIVISGINAGGYTFWTSFTIPDDAGFNVGANTLDFITSNFGGGPTALRVEIEVPDSSLGLEWVSTVWGLTILPCAWLRRKRGA